MDEQHKHSVYIRWDDAGRVTDCAGGFLPPEDLTGWTCIDAGTGSRYALCQSHYFPGGLRTADGLCRWKYENGACALRDEAQLQAERQAAPPPPSGEELALELLADHEVRICMMELYGE